MDENGRLIIDVVDNGGQWTHREWRVLRHLGVNTQIIDNTTPVEKLRDLDGLLLSGGAARVGLAGELGNCAAYLELEVPILGICALDKVLHRACQERRWIKRLLQEEQVPLNSSLKEVDLLQYGGQMHQRRLLDEARAAVIQEQNSFRILRGGGFKGSRFGGRGFRLIHDLRHA